MVAISSRSSIRSVAAISGHVAEGIACNVLWVIPLYGFVVTWIVLMPIMSAYMQSATNRLLDLREHEAATATGPPRLS